MLTSPKNNEINFDHFWMGFQPIQKFWYFSWWCMIMRKMTTKVMSTTYHHLPALKCSVAKYFVKQFWRAKMWSSNLPDLTLRAQTTLAGRTSQPVLLSNGKFQCFVLLELEALTMTTIKFSWFYYSWSNSIGNSHTNLNLNFKVDGIGSIPTIWIGVPQEDPLKGLSNDPLAGCFGSSWEHHQNRVDLQTSQSRDMFGNCTDNELWHFSCISRLNTLRNSSPGKALSYPSCWWG